MQFLGIFLLAFGMIVIAYPQFLAYLIGFFFVFAGINILVAAWMMRHPKTHSTKTWRVGGYEITRNR